MKKYVFNIILVCFIELIVSCGNTKLETSDYSGLLDYCVAQATKTANSLTDASTVPRSISTGEKQWRMVDRREIYLGETKIECAALDARNSVEPVIRKRVATKAHKGYHHILGQIKKMVFATPGVLEPDTQLMRNYNIVCMNGEWSIIFPINTAILVIVANTDVLNR